MSTQGTVTQQVEAKITVTLPIDELKEAALAYGIGVALGHNPSIGINAVDFTRFAYIYSVKEGGWVDIHADDWTRIGPMIGEVKMDVKLRGSDRYCAVSRLTYAEGDTPEQAIARCWLKVKLGTDTLAVPEEAIEKEPME